MIDIYRNDDRARALLGVLITIGLLALDRLGAVIFESELVSDDRLADVVTVAVLGCERSSRARRAIDDMLASIDWRLPPRQFLLLLVLALTVAEAAGGTDVELPHRGGFDPSPILDLEDWSQSTVADFLRFADTLGQQPVETSLATVVALPTGRAFELATAAAAATLPCLRPPEDDAAAARVRSALPRWMEGLAVVDRRKGLVEERVVEKLDELAPGYGDRRAQLIDEMSPSALDRLGGVAGIRARALLRLLGLAWSEELKGQQLLRRMRASGELDRWRAADA